MSENNEATLDTENSADTGTDVDWQKRYTDTQAEYTRQQQLLSDREALIGHIEEKFPDMIAPSNEAAPVVDDTDDGYYDADEEDEEARPMTRADYDKLRAEEKAQDEVEDSHRRFASDLKELTRERELSDQGRSWINEQYFSGKFKTPDDLKKAVDGYFAWEEGVGEAYFEKLKKSKRAPHVPANGQTATGTKPVEDMNREEHTAWMVEQAMAREHQ